MKSLIKTDCYKKQPYLKNLKFFEYKNMTYGVCLLSNEKIKIVCFDNYDDKGNNLIINCKKETVIDSAGISGNEEELLGKRNANNSSVMNNLVLENVKLANLCWVIDYDIILREDSVYIIVTDNRKIVTLYKFDLLENPEKSHSTLEIDPLEKFDLNKLVSDAKTSNYNFSQILFFNKNLDSNESKSLWFYILEIPNIINSYKINLPKKQQKETIGTNITIDLLGSSHIENCPLINYLQISETKGAPNKLYLIESTRISIHNPTQNTTEVLVNLPNLEDRIKYLFFSNKKFQYSQQTSSTNTVELPTDSNNLTQEDPTNYQIAITLSGKILIYKDWELFDEGYAPATSKVFGACLSANNCSLCLTTSTQIFMDIETELKILAGSKF